MTCVMLLALVALEGLIGAWLYYYSDFDVRSEGVVFLCFMTFLIGMFPAVELDKRFPWCPSCHRPWSGRKTTGYSSTPEHKDESSYDSSKGMFEKKSVTVFRSTDAFVCKRCEHRFSQSWTTKVKDPF